MKASSNLAKTLQQLNELYERRRRGDHPDEWMEYTIRPADLGDNLYHVAPLFAASPVAVEAANQLHALLQRAEQSLQEAVNRLQTIQETHPGISLKQDLKRYQKTLTAIRAAGIGATHAK